MIGTVTNRSASLVRRVVEFPGQKPKQKAPDRLIGRPFHCSCEPPALKRRLVIAMSVPPQIASGTPIVLGGDLPPELS